MKRCTLLLLVAFHFGLAQPVQSQSPATTPCDAAEDASQVLQRAETALYLDRVLLREIETQICRARAQFPELQRIHAGSGAGTRLNLIPVLFDSTQRVALARATRRIRAADGSAFTATIPHTGIRALDSLNRRFGGSRVETSGEDSEISVLVITFAQPMNVQRLEAIYEAEGFDTAAVLRNVTTWFYPTINWRREATFDFLRFRLSSECADPCARSEDYLIRFDRTTGDMRMMERHDVWSS